MRKILLIGAGLSSTYLIKYLLEHASKEDWHLSIADAQLELAQQKTFGSAHATALAIDILQTEKRKTLIASHDLIISLLPAHLHIHVAKDCLALKKNLVTASYISDEMKNMDAAVKKAGLLFLNECGLDPGIDHLSAMEMIDELKAKGAKIISFKSYCGGLVAPEYDTNPWHYKFTWNPRNVVLAGQSTARYLDNGRMRFIPPQRLFTETTPVRVDGYGLFESYANRDSLEYQIPYGLEEATTLLRGTLRRQGYSEAWNLFVRLGLTDDSFKIPNSEKLTYRSYITAFIPGASEKTLEKDLCRFLGIRLNSKAYSNIKWLGLFSTKKPGLANASPAEILQHLLQEKWQLKERDLDMIVMKHEIIFAYKNKTWYEHAELVVKGESRDLTAMAKTVGLPLAMAAKHILNNQFSIRGVVRPIHQEIYRPILKELAEYGVSFKKRVGSKKV